MRKKRIKTFLFLLAIFSTLVSVAFSAEKEGELESSVKPYIALASGFGIAIAAIGGAIGQSRAIAAGLEGIARNPGASGVITTPMIIGLALIESLVIYAFVISFLLQLKL